MLPVVARGARAGPARCTCRYYVPGRDETTERDVDPMRLLLVEGRSYLEAWCRRVEGVRLFRLDRVAEVALLDEPSAPPAGRRAARPVAGAVPAGAGRPARHAGAAARPRPGSPTTTRASRSTEHGRRRRWSSRLRARDTAWVRRLVLRLGDAGPGARARRAGRRRSAPTPRAALAAYDEPSG